CTRPAAAALSAIRASAQARPVTRLRRISLPSQFPREVVFERELQLEAVGVEAIGEVLPAAPLQLDAGHHVRHRRIENVAERVLAVLERVGRLAVAVVVVLPRVADAA